MSRQIIPGRAVGVDKRIDHDWIVEPSKMVAQQQSLLVARTLCHQRQAEDVIPVEVYNPGDETVQLYKNTTLGIVTPIQELTGIQLEQ